jgi:hypothetical protein
MVDELKGLPERFELADIERGLRNIPALHASAAEEVADLTLTVKQLKLKAELAEAAAKLQYKQDNPKVTATEINAYAVKVAEPFLEQLYQAERDKEYAVIHAEKLSDMFYAIRKQADIVMRDRYMSGADTKIVPF